MAEPFATIADYTLRGYDATRFSPEVLSERLAAASRQVRSLARGIDARIDDGGLDPDLVADVVCAMVARTVPASGMEGVQAVQQSAGPFARSLTMANPAGDMYLTRSERRYLGIGRQRAFTVAVGEPEEDS